MTVIPLSGGAANAHQIFQIQLGDNTVEFRVNYLTTQSLWTCDILVEGETLAAGVMLLPGNELIETYETGVGRLVMVGDDPTLDNLGTANQLVWVGDNE